MPFLSRLLGFLEDVWIEALAPIFRKPHPADRYKRAVLMTSNEAEFHARLRYAFPPPNWEIWPQVSMLALVQPRLPPGDRNGWTDFNAIQAKRVDWVLARQGEPIAIIELDDRTHDARSDRARDAILAAGRWPVIRFDSRSKPQPPQIARAIVARLETMATAA